ncbi:cytochrome P450, partial [Sneathiella sp.]|uniref:cytochrome P450 n=1 Tax=Sneathiella sp. TaxID=1964365 RepID=UPI0035695CB1
PERFLPSNNKSLDKSAYIPFAGGRHLCLGMHFAMMESVMIVALIGQRFRVRPVSDEPAKIDPGLSLRMKNGYLVYLEPRS